VRHLPHRARPQESTVRWIGWRGRWATVASLIATAKLNEVEPFAYLKDVLERISNGRPMTRLDELLPWNWNQLRAAARNTCKKWTLTDVGAGASGHVGFAAVHRMWISLQKKFI
jgi:hypothetical protein